MDAITADLPLPIAVVTLVEHWTGPVQRADFVNDYGDTGQLALKAGLIGHPSLGYALTPTGRMIRQQTLRLKNVQADGDFNVPSIPEGVLRLIARFTDGGYLNRRSAHSRDHIEIAIALGIVAPTWPPARLALTPKGQILRQAALWTRPTEDDGDEEEDPIEAGEIEMPATQVGKPVSIFGSAGRAAMDPVETLERPRRGRRPGSKNKPREPKVVAAEDQAAAAPVSVRGRGGVEANIEKTARIVEARRAAGPDIVDEAKAAAERKRKLEADIRRWTTTSRR